MMQLLPGSKQPDSTASNSAVTVPGKFGIYPALATEFITAFIMMTMVLFTSLTAG